MATVMRSPAHANWDGFEIDTASGLVGWVEEMWLDRADEPTALALRLFDGRRALLLAADIEEVVAERCAIRVPAETRLLELEPPHLETGLDAPAASWRTTGARIPVPEARGQLHQALISLHRPVVPAQAPKPERPIWRVMLFVYSGLALIALSLIGLCFLVAYLATGSAY